MKLLKNKLLLFGLCAALFGGICAAVELKVFAIKNESTHEVSVQNSIRDRLVAARTLETLEPGVKVPLIPVYGKNARKEYRKAFLEDRPYFPSEALVITTKAGKFAVWEDERGVMCALEFKKGYVSERDCLPERLCKSIKDEAVRKALRLLLVVNAHGMLQANQWRVTTS